MPNEDPAELPEPDKDPRETMRELEKMIEELEQEMRTFAARNRRVAREIDNGVAAIELKEFHNENLELAQRGTNEDAAIGIADSASQEAKQVIDGLRAELAAATVKAAAAPDAAKSYNLQRYLLLIGFLSPSIAAAALIYTAIHAAQSNQPAPAPLPPDTDAHVRQLVRAWNAEADATYWTDLATYVALPTQTPPLTLADQILFMSYTIDLSPASQTWLWDSADDVTALIAQLVGAYEGAQSTAAMYKLAPTLMYKGKAIPRGVTATLLRAALAKILILLDPTPALAAAAQGDGDEPLTPAPDEEQQAREAERDAEEARREQESFAAKNGEAAQQVAQSVATLELSTLNCDNVALAQSEAVAVPNSAIADQTVDARLTELEETLDGAAAVVAELGDTASKQYNITRYLAAIFGVTVLTAAAVVLLEYFARSAQGQPTDDLPPVPEETQQQIHDLVTKWKAQTDAEFWASFAAYVTQHPGEVTGADQVLFLNYTIELCPPTAPFIWDSPADKAKVVDGLVTASSNGADLPALYRALPALTYQGAPVPRAIAADCARLAVAWITRSTLPPRQTAPAHAPLGDPAAGTATTGIPLQLRPRIYVAEVTPGVNPDAYSRSLQLLFRPAGLNNAAALSALAAYHQPAASPYRVLDADSAIQSLPSAAQESVKALIAKLTSAIEAVYPLPDGEVVLSSRLTCLSAPVYDLPAGTVVYERTTTQATVQFVLPRVVVDPVTGVPSLRQDTPGGAPAQPPSATALPGDEFASIALSVAGNLAWVMPPPWGPVTAAGLTLIQLLLGQGDPADQFGAAVQQLEQFLNEQQVSNDAGAINKLAVWLQNQSHTLVSTQVDNSTYITSELFPELHAMTAPGNNGVYDAIYDLENHLDIPGAFGILVLGVTIYLLALKMLVQLDAQLASTAKAAGDVATFTSYTDLWLADYVNFVTAVNGYSENGVTTPGWATKIIGHISDFETARLSQITEPYRYNDQRWVVVTGGGSTGTSGYWVDNWGWTYRDIAAGDTDLTNFVADYDTTGDCCGNGGSHTEYQAQVQAARDQRVTAVSGQLQTTYQDAVSTVKQWTAMIQQWNQHLPPRAPTAAPALGGWNGTAPQGDWVNGSSVAYAVAFVNASGPSQTGPWSAFTPTTTNAFPTLTDLPTDPLGMATNRWIYRQFIRPDGTKSPIRIVGITPDATSTIFKDTTP